MDQIESFRGAMQGAGLNYAGSISADGKIHRFKCVGDHHRNSWYVLYDGPLLAGAFGCWKRDFKETWHERNGDLSQVEWQRVRQQLKEAESKLKAETAKRQKKARQLAAWILARSKPVAMHAYLKAKRIQSFGDLREYRGALVLPLPDIEGDLHSLQFISADGSKKFLRGGRIAGCFFTLADQADGPLVICEGYATGASIRAATGYSVICGLNCGNLFAVAEAVRGLWPNRDIIIAADNDQFTDGNPGLTKATEAAKAIRARLAVPRFSDLSTEPSDFNDLHQLAGIDAVKAQIDDTAPQEESDEEILQRLATLPLLEYERQREDAAVALGCRTSILDKLVDANRPKKDRTQEALQGSAIDFADVELWPDPVNGADVLDAVVETFSRYLALPDGAADALALWCAHTYVFPAFVCSPRLSITSPEKQCGKTLLTDVITQFVSRPLATENLSVAVLFRVIEAHQPTLLADECDTWIRDNEELRGMLNAGHRRGGKALRCEGEGNEVRAFSVFAPVVLAGIGSLPSTLHDRSIPIRLERAKPSEVRERFDSRHTGPEKELCRRLARFCADNRAALETCDPALPPNAFNRLADNWRPLFAIAEVAGVDWPHRAAEAFAKLTSREDADAQGIGGMLLADIRELFSQSSIKEIFSKVLVEKLCAMAARPWPEANRGKPITQNWLANRLRPFGVRTKDVHLETGHAKGYAAADFEEAFARYVPDSGLSDRANVQTPIDTREEENSKRAGDETAHGLKTHETQIDIGVARLHASDSLDLVVGEI